jgi:hypothetical protein
VTAAGSSTCPCSGPGTLPTAGSSTGSPAGYLEIDESASTPVAVGFRRGRKLYELLGKRYHCLIGGDGYYQAWLPRHHPILIFRSSSL